MLQQHLLQRVLPVMRKKSGERVKLNDTERMLVDKAHGEKLMCLALQYM